MSKRRVLRIVSLVQIIYERSPQMKLVFHSLMKCLPFMFIFIFGITFCYAWSSIVMVKAYQDDEYYCDNVHMAVKTKEECFEWGGDWVKQKVNFSSYLDVTFLYMSFCSMEDLTTPMVQAMDFSGRGKTPQYNANEHIQIFYVILYLLGCIVTINFLVSIVFITLRKTKE